MKKDKLQMINRHFEMRLTYNTHTEIMGGNRLTVTNICFVKVLSIRTIIARFALVTVDALSVISAVLAHTTSLIVTMDI
jgi:hypothetical protein